MPNSYFQFKQFRIDQDRCAMKVTTDGCCFGAWVANILYRNTSANPLQRMLDIGTGTVLLSLMVAQQNKGVIEAVEIDPAAAAQAGYNAAASPWGERISVIEADIRNYIPAEHYDVIFSNPPFYENELAGPQAGRNLAHHSTELGLNDLLAFVRQYLQPGGQFFLLLPYKRLEEARRLFAQYQFDSYHVLKIRQSPKHDFFRVVFYIPGDTGISELPEELTITDTQGIYSADFAALLKDYYLKL